MNKSNYGSFHSSGYGFGYGTGYGTGSGYGYGSGYGTGSDYGNGRSSGSDYGYSYYTGSDYGHGYGSGSGYGCVYGHGHCGGYGHGAGHGLAFGSADGSGDGYNQNIDIQRDMFTKAPLNPKRALTIPNTELRRVAIECMGPDRFFGGIDSIIVDEDKDVHGNRRRLLKVPVVGANAGFLLAIEVVCPSTGRVYHLGVRPNIENCQDAVASTFGLIGDEYRPWRET